MECAHGKTQAIRLHVSRMLQNFNSIDILLSYVVDLMGL